MSGDFLGVGWPSPLRLTSDGKIEMARYEEAVRQSIWMILSTAPGERMMRPDFGCGIHNLVFATLSAGTLGLIINEVTLSLTRWEPRITVLGVDAAPDPEAPNRLLVQIQYEVRTTNNLFNLVYPFYLTTENASGME